MKGDQGDVKCIPPWAIASFFLLTSYNCIYKRYLPLALGMEVAEEAQREAAVAGIWLSVLQCTGMLFFSRGFDMIREHTISVRFVMGAAASASLLAAALSFKLPMTGWLVKSPTFLAILLSCAPLPLRDAIAVGQTKELQAREDSRAGSFGQYRLYLVVGQVVVANVTSNLMWLMGANACLITMCVLLCLTLLLYASMFPKAVVDRLLQKKGETLVQPKQEESYSLVSSSKSTVAPARAGLLTARVGLLFLVNLLAGISTGVTEVLLFVHLEDMGTSLAVLGVVHAVSLAMEIPVFYFENWFVAVSGGYEEAFFVSCITTTLRLIILASVVVDRPATALTSVLVIMTESLHGMCRAPVAFATAHMAQDTAEPELKTTLQAVLNVANGPGGIAAGCGIFWLCYNFGARANFFLAASCAFLAAVGIIIFQPRILSRVRRCCSAHAVSSSDSESSEVQDSVDTDR